MKKNSGKRVQRFTLTTCSKLKGNKRESSQVHVLSPPYKNASSPCLATSHGSTNSLPRSCSAIFYTDYRRLFDGSKLDNQMLVKTQGRALSTFRPEKQQASVNVMRGLEAVCACPCPCPGNCCLPPPCNTPPKCLQYMTGYYYYPYGTWFCGPYHVATGPCGPCTGPVTPGGPCGPSGPCPGGPCGPPGLACACGPLRCCGVCGSPNIPPNHLTHNTQNAFSSNTQFVPFNMQSMYPNAYGYNDCVQYSYDPTTSFTPYPPGHDMAMPWAQQNMPGPSMPGQNTPSRNPTGPFFGPGINVPISPIPITNEPCGPILPTPNPSIPTSPKPKSSVRINRDYMQDSQTSPYGSKPPMPTRPPMPTSSKSSVYINRPYTGTRPISTIRNLCSSNLTPKPLRPGPPSRYDAICALSRHHPIAKPRINNRTLPRLDTIQICYYTTRSMKKYVHNDTRLASGEKRYRKLVKNHVQDEPSTLSHKVDRKPLCYWCLISDKNSCPCRLCGFPTMAQKTLPMNDIISNCFQIDGRQKESILSQDSKIGERPNDYMVSDGSKTESKPNEYLVSDGSKTYGRHKEYIGSQGSKTGYIKSVGSKIDDRINKYKGSYESKIENKHQKYIGLDSETDSRPRENKVLLGSKKDTREMEYIESHGSKTEGREKEYVISNDSKSRQKVKLESKDSITESRQRINLEKKSFKRSKWF